MPATIYSIDELEQGSTFELDIEVTDPDTGEPVDLAGYSARSQARSAFTDAEPAFVFDVSEPTAEGVVSMSLSDEASAAIPKGTYVYDLELQSPTGKVVKLIKGKIKVTPEATK